MVTRGILAAPVLFLHLAIAQQHLPVEALEAKLKAKIAAYDQKMDGVLGVTAIDLTSGRTISYNGDVLFPTASVIKVPILVEIFRLARAGEFRMSDRITLEPSELVGGSGHLQNTLKNGPIQLTILDLITAMIETSDNTATNRAIKLAHMDRVNVRTQQLGLTQTRLRRIMLDTEAAWKGNENITTPMEISRLVEMIYRGKAGHPDDCKEMIRIMKLVKGRMRDAIPANVEIASKTGDLTGVKCQTGIVYHPKRPFVVSVFGTYLTGEETPVAAITKMVYDHFDLLGSANVYGNRGVR
ncbi:hypothetical protein F183_A48080 [Bryobacterales bacterium F-183]|nr:hypothetical protein F183_A48080 [Bryobacterales bacterium F-183]